MEDVRYHCSENFLKFFNFNTPLLQEIPAATIEITCINRYAVPTGRVVVPTGRYVVPAGKVIFIVSTGRLSLVPTGSVLSPGNDYSRFTWVKFLRTKDETPDFNGIVEQRNCTLVEAARTMLIFSKAPLFLWAEAVAIACYTQNRSLIHTLHNKTPYELVRDKKPDLSFLHIFGALCYPINDSEDLGKLKAKVDIGFFVGYAPNKKGYKIYNKRTRQIMETIHVTFDELTEQMAPLHSSPGPAHNLLTHGPISSGLVPNPLLAAPYVPPTNKELEILFQPMFDEYFKTSTVDRLVPHAPATQAPVNPIGPSVSIPIDQEAPSGSHSPSSLDHQSSLVHQGVAAEHSFKVNPFAAADPEPFVNVFAPDHNSEASSSG
ncbi:retrovirus-related pol polyprotein from transposon TNT 1-94, partial [Tanacetum coccineum]